MIKPVNTGSEATSELAAALAWYDQRRPGLGSRFLQATDRAIRYVADFPSAGSPIAGTATDLTLRRFSIPGFPYHLVYLELKTEIRVLAIAHDSRAPGYWLERVTRRG